MPIISPPMTTTCTKCNWSKTQGPMGDVRLPGQAITQCPRCGSTALSIRPATAVDAALAQVLNPFGKLFGR